MNRQLKVASVAVAALACVSLASCASISKINPFPQHKENKIKASKGERVSILTFDQKVEASKTLAGVEFSIPEAQPVTAWPLPGGNPEQAMDNVQAAPDLQVAWRRRIGAGSGRTTQVVAPPVAVDGFVFTMDGSAVVEATDAKGGGHGWRADLRPTKKRDREGFGGGMAVSEGKVFVSSGYRFMAALDSKTGKVLWKTPVESPIHAAPTVSGGRVFAVDVDNQILAFDINTGEVAWSYQAIVEPARILKASSPAVSGDSIVAPFSSGELVALRIANGNPLWNEVLSRTSRTNALSEIRDIPGRPAIYRGDVFAVSHSGVFAAVDLRTGRRRWDLPVAGVNSPWPAGDVVYVVSKAGEVIAANRENGQVYWIQDLNKDRVRMSGGFARVGRHEERPVWTGPVLANGRLIMLNNWGELIALDAKTGVQQKSLKIGDPSFIAPIAYDGQLFVVTDKADLIAIR